ncbi:T9SS type A sorting domain-containing protein [bacterium]|nr:T9SS type A sorting domain-containing protein [bacterium]
MKRAASFLLCLIPLYSGLAQVSNIQEYKAMKAEQREKRLHSWQSSSISATPNQAAYDVSYYHIDLRPDPQTSTLHGRVRVVGRALQASLNHIELDFWSGMQIASIVNNYIPDVNLSWHLENDLLDIDLAYELNVDELFSIDISYSGKPQNSNYGAFGFDHHNGEPMIWSSSEPYGARSWWPCKDDPQDKPDSVDIFVTVPNNMMVASNGVLRAKIETEFLTTYKWHEKYPIATYLVSIAAYQYKFYTDDYVYGTENKTMPIHFYVFPDNYERYYSLTQKVKDMLTFFSDIYGEYPFVDEKYGHADYLRGGAMEHQTCSSFSFWNEGVFAHELAHQWWGDLVTCKDFHHIWLNEGFADYSEPLWFEHANPGYTASEYMVDYQQYFGPGTIYVEDPYNDNVFEYGLTYQKSSWVVHMLRHILGETGFRQMLQTFLSSPEFSYGHAETKDIQALCEDISGLNLDKFFQQWIYEEYFPVYGIGWNAAQRGSDYDITLEIQQNQTGQVFWMPIDVFVETETGTQKFVVWDSLATQTFHLTVDSKPIKVELDRDNWILKRMLDPLINPTLDQGILLVNGVSWTYGEEIRNAYKSNVYTGDYPITFWDCFNEPAGGYPATLPQPLGHGDLPVDILSQYSTIIWLGNNYGGDLSRWQPATMLSYLKAGGNVLLISRHGSSFIYGGLQTYLGINWLESGPFTLSNCAAVHEDLAGMRFVGNQSYCDAFELEIGHEDGQLLFTDTQSGNEDVGIGVWRRLAAGGMHKSDGGNFIFISGRSYRFVASDLKSNISVILDQFIGESESGVSSDVESILFQNFPNPFTTQTEIHFKLLPGNNGVINIYDLLGRLVHSFTIPVQTEGGIGQITWDGRASNGDALAAGVYLIKYTCGDQKGMIKIIML